MPKSHKQKSLSVLMSELLRIANQNLQAHEDVDAYYAPSECHNLVAIGTAARLKKWERKNRIKVSTVLSRAEKRTSAKWMFYRFPSGVLQ